MLSRYSIVRGKQPAHQPLPRGVRQDTRKHTRHVLRPSPELVARFLKDPSTRGFSEFRARYLELLEARWVSERQRFDELVQLARERDVLLGCNCPTRHQPDVRRCHTWLALEFLKQAYPDLRVVFPDT